jgi:colanic acid/amylovoran biosynthesis glycosyltransferase
MRILHLWDNFAPGLFDRSHAMCLDQGHDSHLLCMHLFPRLTDRELPVQSVRQIDEAKDNAQNGRLHQAIRRAWDRNRFRRMVRRWIANHSPDLVHFHFGSTMAALEGVAGLSDIPFVVSFYGFDISAGLENRGVREAYHRLLPGAGIVHVLCEAARERAIALGARPERTVLANLPLDVSAYPEIGQTSDRIERWLIPARFVAKKGHLVLLDAFRQHLNQHPSAHLTCWGYGSDRWLIDEIRQRGLHDRVSVSQSADPRGFDAAYQEQLAKHDCILAPSIRAESGDDEGGPALTAVLAQAAAKPVIYSDFPGSECSVTDGVEGLIVPQGDATALASAMARLSADPARAAAMGLAGRRRVLSEFTPEAYAKALLGWYAGLAR